jgi:methylated-DNA-protein-cysteine methyltransferase-like protein
LRYDFEPMARSTKAFAELFLPPSAKRSPRRPASVEDNPAIQVIWDMVAMIPRGKVSTYGAVARAAGLPGRARLTGFALKVAPKEMNLPWHRVVGAGGRIVFPKTSQEHREQARRLRAERVAVKDGRVDRSCITDFEAP